MSKVRHWYKKWYAWVIVALTLIVVGWAGVLVIMSLHRQTIVVQSGMLVTHAYVARTQAEHERGLGGFAMLPSNRSMLFVFEQPGYYGIWMKDMRFAIDIVWADATKRIVHIEHEVQPDTYPQSFRPEKPALYVLETAAGETRHANLKVGDVLQFALEGAP